MSTKWVSKLKQSGLRNFFPVRVLYRLSILWKTLAPILKNGLRWLPARTENSNFYYELSANNRADLASTLGFVFETEPRVFEAYFREILQDEELRNHLLTWKQKNPSIRDSTMAIGRRVVWFAIVRHIRPRLVVETGVYHGVGACVIAAALQRNAEDGHQGRYIGTELNPNFGWMFSGPYQKFGRILFGDSVTSLSALDGPVDLFINDSDHSSEYEREEYVTIGPLLSPTGVVLGDNCDVTLELNEWSRKEGRRYLFIPEYSQGHWFPGGGIGLSIASKEA